ncbi:MAG TPA: T9SS type A sorting domain-containing protein, partial [Bacteroidia bacterium]|nr:T9SS type A sorting domain-containing protein [Bacteroidia bacterium]
DTLVANAFGNVPFSYNWSTSSTSDSITVSTANTYSVTVTDANGCKGTATASVTVNSLPTATISGLSAICAGTMDTLVANASGSSPFTYNWSTSSTNDSIAVSTANTYSVTVSDANGCKGTATASVTVNPLPTITITGMDSIVSGTNDTLTASGGTSYVWTSGSTTDTTVVAPTTTTTYSVTATNSFGCSAIDSFTVVIRITTGIANLSENNSTNLYPNPATTNLSLSFTMQGKASEASIDVIDITGKTLMETNTEISNGKTLPIDISQLSPGVYFVKITTAKTSQTIKFVKQDR